MRTILLMVLAAALLGGCGDGEAEPPGAGAAAPGEALTVSEALATDASEPLLVRGALVAVDGQPPRLCEVLLESFPPQCGQPALVLEGADLSAFGPLQTEGGVTWSDDQVSVLGTVDGTTLTVLDTAI